MKDGSLSECLMSEIVNLRCYIYAKVQVHKQTDRQLLTSYTISSAT